MNRMKYLFVKDGKHDCGKRVQKSSPTSCLDLVAFSTVVLVNLRGFKKREQYDS